MDRYLNFEINIEKFSNIEGFISTIQENDQKAIFVLGSGIGV